jgi:Ca-activated chloride channel family protein
MKIDCQLDYATIQANQARPVHLALKFTAPTLEKPRKEACAFTLVVDRSGSMSGKPLEYAKKACLTVLKNLRPEDQFAVVQFDSNAEVLIPLQPAGTSRSKFESLIEKIQEAGSTNLTAGWMLGRDELKKADAGTRRRLLLLTDGHLNVGITDPTLVEQIVAGGLEKDGVRTATLGFGDGYDAQLLRALAKRANGEFYDVDSPEKLPSIFTAELEGLQSVTVTNLRVRIQPLTFCESWSQCSDYHSTLLPDNRTEISVGDLVSGEERSLVLALEVLPLPLQADGTPLTTLDGELLLGLEILWDQIDEEKITSRRHEQNLRIQATQNPEDIKLNEEVVAIIATQVAGKAMDEATKDIQANRLDAARSKLEKLQKLLEQYGVPEKLSDALRLLETMNQVVREGQFNARSLRTAHYMSNSSRKMSSSAIWTAPASAPAPTYNKKSIPPTPPPAAPETEKKDNDDPSTPPTGGA